eukprot:a738_16.p1 GENE.a738_16~~a738_16.p1  ORF type:complete len:403 (+),score=138.88 a738_16:31-1209(+)
MRATSLRLGLMASARAAAAVASAPRLVAGRRLVSEIARVSHHDLRAAGGAACFLRVPLASAPVKFRISDGMTVKDLVSEIKREDPSVKDVSFVFRDGTPVNANALAGVVLNGPSAGPATLALRVDGKSMPIQGDDVGDGGALDLGVIAKKRAFQATLSELRGAGRAEVTVAELVRAAAEHHLTESEALAMLRASHASGAVLHFYGDSQLHPLVFLEPDAAYGFTKGLVPAERREALAQRLAAVDLRLATLLPEHQRLDRKASRHAMAMLWLGFGGVLVQLVGIARLTWWEFSWDIMEPISYCASAFQGIVLYSFYQVLNRNPDSKVSVKEFLHDRKLAKLYKKTGFDSKGLASLQAERAQLLEQLKESPRESAEAIAAELLEDAARAARPQK